MILFARKKRAYYHLSRALNSFTRFIFGRKRCVRFQFCTHKTGGSFKNNCGHCLYLQDLANLDV